jgi:RluA family pseudouridine synthase
MKLVDHIAAIKGISKKKAKQIIDSRRVFVNKRRIWMAGHELRSGDSVEITEDSCRPDEVPLKILYQDKDLIIINKPAGVLSTGPSSVEPLLTKQLKRRVHAVHRLDRDTSGVMILAFNERILESMKELFLRKKITKTYRALSAGRFSSGPLVIRTPLEGKPALTIVTALEAGNEASLLEIVIETGRTHQIRKHLAEKGIHLLGEKEYDRSPVRKDLFRKVTRQMLHAFKIAFPHPASNQVIDIHAEPPDDFLKIMSQAGLTGTSSAGTVLTGAGHIKGVPDA